MAKATTTKRSTTRKPKLSDADNRLVQSIQDGLSTAQDTAINHGLQIPQWDVNSALPSDLATDSSSLPVLPKAEADTAIESIEGKRNTLRVIQANVGLTGDAITTATQYRKLEGLAIDYATTGVDNQAKAIRYQVAETKLATEAQKLIAQQESLAQATIKAEALKEITGFAQDEWEQRKLLAQSKVNTLRVAVQQADATYQQALRNLLSEDSEP